MKRFCFLILAIVLLASSTMFTSCKYKDLCYDHNHWSEPNLVLKLDLKLDLDLDIDVEVSEEAHTKIEIPTYMVVGFYDPESGSLRKTEFVGPYGGPLQVTPGIYNMVVYSFDTEWTQVRGEGDLNTLEAFTSDITEAKLPLFSHFNRMKASEAPGPIIYTPDHLLMTAKHIEIPQFSTEDIVMTIEATAATIVQTYGIETMNITGVENIASAEAFITNQARSSFFGRGEISQEPATIYFPMEINREEGTIETTFNTFGKLPGESQCYLYILLLDTEGTPYTVVEDVTDMFNDSTHMIQVSDTIDIPTPASESGGIAPTVNPWEEENHDVQIG